MPFSNQLIKSDSNHISNFIRVSPNDKIESPLGIDVWLWHNQKTIFVYWEVEIDSNFVEGNFNQKDLPPKSDELRMQIITNYLDNSAYTFWATPKSNSIDAIRLPNMQFDMNWNSNYTYKSKVTDTLWVVLTEIPFNDLRFATKSPYEWKVILTRLNIREDELYSYPNVTIEMQNKYFSQAADILIEGTIETGRSDFWRTYFVKYYDLISQTQSFDPKYMGIDYMHRASSTASIKATYNPDFSDVPLDSEIDNYNSINPTYFPVYRYFFQTTFQF